MVPLAYSFFFQSFTLVTGTIVDPNGNPYKSGTISAYTGSGSISYNGALDTAGAFSFSIPPGSYLFTACATPVNLGPLGNTAPKQVCFTSPVIAVTGNAQDVSAAMNVNSAIIGPAFGASGGGTTPSNPSLHAIVSPSIPVQFGQVQNGTTSQPQIVTITNDGDGPITVFGAVLPIGSRFSSTNLGACNGNLPPNGVGCSLLINYNAPVAGGSSTDTLTFITSAPIDLQSPLTVTLVASGSTNPTAQISLLDLGLGSGTAIDTNNPNSLDGTLANGQCVGTCIFNYQIGTVLNIVATPSDATSQFGQFGGGGLSTSPGILTVTQDQIITVTFNLTPVNHNVNIAITGQGSGGVITDVAAPNGTMSCNSVAGVISSGGGAGCGPGVYPDGTVLTFTESPLATNTFLGWIGVCPGSTSTTCQITVRSDITATANFASTTTIPIALVQGVTAPTCSTSGTTTTCLWASAQNAGDFIALAIAVPDTSTTISSVTDTKGNTYTLDVGPTTGVGLRQWVYHAQNIVAAAAGANTTTVTYSTSVASSISGTLLGSNQSLSGGTTIATPSVTLGNNQLITAAIWDNQPSGNGASAPSSISGCGLTWVQIGSGITYGTVEGTGKSGFSSLWRTLGNGSSCVVTATWGATQSARAIAVSEASGIDTSGSNGSGAIGITASNSGHNTNPSVTMGTFGSSANGTFGMTTSNTGLTTAAGAGMTLLNNQGHDSDEWAAGNVGTVGFTYSGGTTDWGAIAIEVKASGGSGRRDVRAVEYSGVLQSGNPLDISSAATGSSATAAPGNALTTVNNDLVVNFTLSNQSVLTPATSFTQRLKNTFGDTAEDIEGAAIATYNPSDTLSASGNWISTQVAYKPQTAQSPTVFSITTSIDSASTGTGNITSNIGTPIINCPTAACSTQVNANSTVILSAIANPGSAFLRWKGITGCDISAQCTVPNITASQNVSAQFVTAGVTNYYVAPSPTGNDSRTATQALNPATPWATIDHAASSFTGSGTNGIVVHVADGTYPNANISRGGPNIQQRLVIQCDNGIASYQAAVGHCKFTGSGSAITLSNGSNIDIVGFDIGGNPNQKVAIVGIPCGPVGHSTCLDSIHAIGNYIHDAAQNVALDASGCPSLGDAPGAILILNHHGWFVNDLQVIGNAVLRYGPSTNPACNTGPNGFYIDTQGVQIYNNLIVKVYNFGIQYYGQPCNGRISNNIIITNNAAMTISGGGESICTPGIMSINNNILGNTLGSHGKIWQISSMPCTDSSHQSFWGSNVSDGIGADFSVANSSCNTITPNGGSNVFTHASMASLMINPLTDGTGNYQLSSTSSAINNGTTTCVSGGATPCVPFYDILNVTRPQRTKLDQGAFELP